MGRMLTKKDWMQKARKIHGRKYIYGKSDFRRTTKPVEIVCKIHGAFTMTPRAHLEGKGCPLCGHTKTTEVFIFKAKECHGDLYDYTDTVYKGSGTKVAITCRTHGIFMQKPSEHIRGKGCPKCAACARKDTETFKVDAEEVHGGRYDYSQVDYKNSYTKVAIVCEEHGPFLQKPNDHLSGQGCPRCPKRYNEPTSLYIMTNGVGVKVGYSIDPYKRVLFLNRNSPFKIQLRCWWTLQDAPTARNVETEVHDKLKEYQINYDRFDGYTEWFDVSVEEATKVIESVIESHKLTHQKHCL